MKVTIIEDDVKLAENIAKKIQKFWYAVSVYNDKESFKSWIKQDSDLYIIDINLKSGNEWFEIIKWLREEKESKKPVLIMSGYNDTDKKVHGLDIWADDYITKPVDPDELLARIRALLRREKEDRSALIKYKTYIFDTKNKYFVEWIDKNKHFTKKEIRLIEFFILNKWKRISKNELITAVWGDYDGLWVTDNTINVTIHNLRKKLWDDFNLDTMVWEWYILRD